MADVVELTVNGARHRRAQADFLDALRNYSSIRAKFGCGLGQCGACTVIVDGDAVRSWSFRLRSRRRQESHDDRRSRTIDMSGEAFIDEQAAQCGYCINGVVMAAMDHRSASDVSDSGNPGAALAGTRRRARMRASCAPWRAREGAGAVTGPTTTAPILAKPSARSPSPSASAPPSWADAASFRAASTRTACSMRAAHQSRRHRHRLHRQDRARPRVFLTASSRSWPTSRCGAAPAIRRRPPPTPRRSRSNMAAAPPRLRTRARCGGQRPWAAARQLRGVG